MPKHYDDKHKEIVGIDDRRGAESSTTSYSLLSFYMERYPERDEAKETKASFPQAWSMFDFPKFKASLDEAEGSGLGLVRLIQSFESAFSGVPFAWEDISKDPLSSSLDVSLTPGYPELVDWIVNDGPSLSLLGDFIVWAFGHILDSLFHYRWKKGHSPTHLSDVSIFPALALVLRSRPVILPMYLRALDEIHLWYEKKGAVTCPVRVWMVHQVSSGGNLHAALFSWVRFLLPQLQVVPSYRESILHLVEKIFEKPGAQTQLVECPTLCNNQLFPHHLFEILLRVTFPATEEDTTRLLKVYTSLKEVALAYALLHEQLTRFMFTLSLRLAGEGNPGLAKEAIEIAIWCMKNVDCSEDWYDLCQENLEASVALLTTLTENEKLKLNLLPSSNKAMPDFIQPIFTVSLTLAGEGNPVLAKEAAKISIWCLTQHVNCWSHLRYLYRENLEASVALLKALVDEWPALSLKLPSLGRLFIQQMFTISLTLAGEENAVLAKEATGIAIWSLIHNFHCWTYWQNLCSEENPKASVVLLKALVEKWDVRSLPLSYLTNKAVKIIIGKVVTSCLKIARQGISILDTVVPGNPVLLGKASLVAIWSLPEIVDCCCNRWDDLYWMSLEVSVTLLNNLVKKCKDLSLGGAPEREAMKQVFQQIFTFSLRLAGKENHVLAKEAIAISIWSLTENFDCCTHWDNLYEENIKASVRLLKKLVHEWNGHSRKLSLSPSDTLTLSLTIKMFRLKNQKAIAEGGDNGYLYEKADKFCKVISRRLSPGSCSLKWACITTVVLVAALVPFNLTVFGLYK